MTTNKKAAPARAAKQNAASSNTCCNRITFIESGNDTLTRVYKCDGSSRMATETCGAADRIRQSAEVSSLDEAVATLYAESGNQHECVILGQYVGDEAAKRTSKGQIVVSHDNFKDCPRNLIIFNIGISTTASGTEEAAASLLAALPSYCHDAKYHLHFTEMGKDSVCGYLMFWLEVPMNLSRIKAWAKKTGVINLLSKYWFSCVSQVFIANPIGEDCTVKVPAPTRYSGDGRDLNLLPISYSPSVQGVQTGNTQELNIVTIVESYGQRLTKLHRVDAPSESYEAAQSFFIHEPEIRGIRGWGDYFHKNLANNIHRAQIHGRLRRDGTLLSGNKEGSVSKVNANFEDQALNLLAIDIDKFEPPWADPLLQPEQAIGEFFKEYLPEFIGCSYFWQLSSSAGLPGNEGTLKAHVWVWTKHAYTCAQLHEWAISLGPGVIDKAIYRRVQFRYTANPVFEKGRNDPVVRRHGLFEGESDVVDLVIKEAILANARETGAGEGGNDKKLVDPSEKDGLIGLFHRTYSAEQVLLELLEGEFIQVNQRRWTWLNGGGNPEGVWVHDDDMHVGASHDSWPLGNTASNLWDIVRVFKFGHLDKVETEDAFERENAESIPFGHRPSDHAMREYAAGLDEIKAAILEEESGPSTEALNHWRTKLTTVQDLAELRHQICPGIATDDRLDRTSIEMLAGIAKNAFTRVGFTMGLPAVKKLLKAQPVAKKEKDDKPDWLKRWCYVTDRDKFFRHDTQEWLSFVGFGAKYNRLIPKSEDGERVSAASVALSDDNIPVVVCGLYLPGKDPLLVVDGMKVVNTYRPSSVPREVTIYSESDLLAIEVIEEHIRLLCDGRDAVAATLLDYLAFNVQNPGTKVRWAPVIKGVEGDGKSLLSTLLSAVMGGVNVKTISTKAITSDFTSWARGACIGVIEELRMVGHNRYDALNSIKPCIANDTIAVHPKGGDEYNCPNTMNYIAFTNFVDALPLDDKDRRWFVLFTPWDNIDEFAKKIDGSIGEYFDRIHEALEEHGPALRKWFLDRKLSSEFKPNGRAPDTAEKATMISLALSDADVILRDLIAEGCRGVSQAVVSTSCLSATMRALGCEPPLGTSMNRMMSSLGFKKFNESVKWEGGTHRVWTKQPVTLKTSKECKDEIRRLLDLTTESDIAEDFKD